MAREERKCAKRPKTQRKLKKMDLQAHAMEASQLEGSDQCWTWRTDSAFMENSQEKDKEKHASVSEDTADRRSKELTEGVSSGHARMETFSFRRVAFRNPNKKR